MRQHEVVRGREHGGAALRPVLAAWTVLAAWIAGVAMSAMVAAPAAALTAGGSWQAIGPSGGPALSLAVDPADAATAYAACGPGGLFKTVDGGLSWSHSDAGLLPGAVIRVVVDPLTPSTVYAATVAVTFRYTFQMSGGGVFKSTDGGATWSPAGSGLGGAGESAASLLSDLAIDPQTPSTLFAAVGDTVFRSQDGAASWTASGAGLRPNLRVKTVVLDPAAPSTVYAGTSIGVWKSTDGGASWLPARQGMALAPLAPIAALAVDPQAHETVYAGASPGSLVDGQARGLYVSTDGGASWTAQPVAAGNPRVSCLAVSPADHSVFACAQGRGLYRSLGGGGRWQPIDQGLPATAFAAVAIAASRPDQLLAGVAAGGNGGPAVYASADEGSLWTPAGGGLAAIDPAALAADPVRAGRVYVGTGASGVLATTDDGGGWAPANAGLGSGLQVSALAVDPLAPATLYAETDGGFFVSHNGARHWSLPGAAFPAVPALAVDPHRPSTLYSAATRSTSGSPFEAQSFYKSVDGGATWTLLLPQDTDIPACAVAPSAPATVYVARQQENVISLLRSQNGGAAFVRVFSLAAGFFPILAIDPGDAEVLYFEIAGTPSTQPSGLFKSTDGGATRTRLAAPVAALLIDPADPSVLYAGTASGVVVSADGGATWAELAPGLPPAAVYLLARGPGALYAGVEGHGVYRLSL